MADNGKENGKSGSTEKNERGGRGKGGRSGRGEGRGEGGKGRPRKPRAEIPTYDDPEAELKKLKEGDQPPKPNRDSLDRKIEGIQKGIETNKKRTEAITAELDSIKAKNERLKEQGSGALEACRENLREMKKQIVGVIEERKQISASIDKIREAKSSQDEAIKKQRAAIGRFSSNESIDEEIRRIEDYMAHNSIDLKQEKECMQQIKELNKKRDDVKALEVMEGKRGGPGNKSMSLSELFEARKKVDAKLDELRSQEKVAVDAMQTQREKTQSKDSGRFEKLLGERKEIRDKISADIASIREMRNKFQEEDDKWFEHDRLEKNLKWQVRQKTQKEREARQAEWEEEKKKKQAEWEAEKEYRKNFDEDGNPREKFLDWDLSERIMQCEQLIVFLEGYTLKDTTNTTKDETASSPQDGRTVEVPSNMVALSRNGGLDDDPLGLNALMVDEVVSKRSKKKDKKKKQNASKNDNQALLAEGEVVVLELSMDMFKQFADMGLPVPVNSNDCEASIAQLRAKKCYYEEKGEAGMSLKDVLKAERDAKRGNKGKQNKEEKTEETENEGEVKFNEERVDQSDKEIAKATKGGFAAPKGKVVPKKELTDEEKKARGLLYDTSKASAVRDDSDEDEEDEAADFAGGDPFEGL